ncbi:JAB domain-containing protein [Flavivirga aquimarina]|uniref:JAB domain-containing protein n=1 Tax=Flavivirga aquimarina TaxID=2027862 RepID=A0ABT8W889_9FLAO|nr:JAB domain-containing protein [Flavivirga aquimarina]MDO5969301.1 JAB domain-containing protein [Flavivirga aquimarina]
MKAKLLKPLLEVSTFNEIEIYYKRPIFNQNRIVKNSKDSERLLRAFIDDKRIDYKEFFWVMLLSNANQVIGISEIAMGNTSSVPVNIKEIHQLTLLANASAIIVAHNHPSGKLSPSESDKSLTKKLKNTSKLFDVTLLDHLILTSEDFISFSDNHWI